MLRITANVFSGRPNPVWEIGDESEVRATLRALTADRDLLAEAEPGQGGLGFRGFEIEMLSDELAQDFGLDASVYLPAGGSRAAELVERLIGLIEPGEAPTGTAEITPPLDVPLKDFSVRTWGSSPGILRARHRSLTMLHHRPPKLPRVPPVRSSLPPSIPGSGTTTRTS